jgi:hypothetical protein
MGTPATTAQLLQKPDACWNLFARVAFRFGFVYLVLYCLTSQVISELIPIPKLDIPDFGLLWPMRQLVFWVAAHIFHVSHPLVFTGSGSGDKTFDWVLAFCLFGIAAIATIVWSLLDRSRVNYVTLHKWFRLFIRFALGSEMLVYGMAKVVPLQMPFPFLTRLLEPFGNFSPMGVLWSSIGASHSYETYAGSAEVLCGILLLIPGITLLGASASLIVSSYIFVLNMTYDVPVKLFSFHLILMSLVLLLPDFPRLTNLYFLNRPVGPSTQPKLFGTRRANMIAAACQIVIGMWILGTNVYGSWRGWYEFGGGRTKSALYGIWNVDQQSVDGQIRSPLLNDFGRYRRLIFDFPTSTSFQRTDDTFSSYGAAIDSTQNTLTLTKGSDKTWKANFHFQRPAPDQLILDGDMDGRKIHMELHLFDRNKFLLVNRGYHWIQEIPLNR